LKADRVLGFLAFVVVLYLTWSYRRERIIAPPTARKVAFLSESEGADWHDLRFRCAIEQRGATRLFHLRNEFEGHEVGIDVEVTGRLQSAIGPDAQGQFGFDRDKLKGLEVRFLRADTRSDRLIQVLDRLYQTKLGRKHMVNSFRFDAIPLRGEEHGLAKVKLFGNSNGPEGAYFEVFLNIDFREGWAEIAEKDPEYRVPMMKALSTN